MDCPFCSGQMVPGYIQSESPILWSAKKRKLLFLPDPDTDDVLFDNADGLGVFGIPGVHREASRCSQCGAIVILNQD